jgi:hypothetical protein
MVFAIIPKVRKGLAPDIPRPQKAALPASGRFGPTLPLCKQPGR